MRTRYSSFPRLPIIVTALLTTRLSAQQPTEPQIDIRTLMSVAQFQQTGLTKLTDTELQALNRWLSSFAVGVLNDSTGKPHNGTPGANTPEVVESKIDGEFNGWEGETIFKLANGQIWQQSSYAYTYHYAFRPDVLIFRTSGGYKMHVEGVDQTIYVVRLR